MLVPFIVAEHALIAVLLVVGSFCCIVTVTLPDVVIRRAAAPHSEIDSREADVPDVRR